MCFLNFLCFFSLLLLPSSLSFREMDSHACDKTLTLIHIHWNGKDESWTGRSVSSSNVRRNFKRELYSHTLFHSLPLSSRFLESKTFNKSEEVMLYVRDMRVFNRKKICIHCIFTIYKLDTNCNLKIDILWRISYICTNKFRFSFCTVSLFSLIRFLEMNFFSFFCFCFSSCSFHAWYTCDLFVIFKNKFLGMLHFSYRTSIPPSYDVRRLNKLEYKQFSCGYN